MVGSTRLPNALTSAGPDFHGLRHVWAPRWRDCRKNGCMRHVVIDWRGDGYWLDPRPYLSRLPTLSQNLREGARAYAAAPNHYDLSSDQCVKDLWFR